jgi:hypothetical protein
MALISHTKSWVSTNGFIEDVSCIDFWKNDPAVVPADEINDSHEVELPLDGSSLSLDSGVDDCPWDWNSGWASKVKWEVPDVVKFLGIDTPVDNSVSELLWDHLPVEHRNKLFKILWVVHELSETRYKTVCHGIVVINDDICEGS